MKKHFILIGGGPGIGKTSLAVKLSEEIKLPWISTDAIREIMRKTVKEEDYPNLFLFTKVTAENYLKKNNPEQIVKDMNNESFDVWKGIEALIKGDYWWDDHGYIIEGIAILPILIYKNFPNIPKNINPIFLINNDRKKIKEVIYKRGLWADADKYPDELKDLEVEWVFTFNNWLEQEAKKYKYPTINLKGKNITTSEVKKYL